MPAGRRTLQLARVIDPSDTEETASGVASGLLRIQSPGPRSRTNAIMPIDANVASASQAKKTLLMGLASEITLIYTVGVATEFLHSSKTKEHRRLACSVL